eukprot:6206243-Pleurochrysis_carterae.AAC.1
MQLRAHANGRGGRTGWAVSLALSIEWKTRALRQTATATSSGPFESAKTTRKRRGAGPAALSHR